MLEYKLIGRNDISDIQECIFENRSVNKAAYTHLNSSVVQPYDCIDNISEGVTMYVKHVNEGKKIGLVVDCDCDGFCSSAVIYSYTKRVNPNIEIVPYFHTGKQHGLSEDITIDKDIDLLIIPDAGTNDVEQCKVLNRDILIIDHHQKEVDNNYAIVINNQCSSKYNNKNACGCHMVWQFLRAVDDELWTDYADDYLDLVAVADIADNMDIRDYETKYIVSKGLNRITNEFIETIIDKRSFDIKGRINPHSIGFYVSPLINAVCRVGTQEEKELMFKAFIEDYAEFEYINPRTKETITENIYERMFRLSSNAKSRQDNAVKKIVPILSEGIEKNGLDNNAIMFVNAGEMSGAYTGLVSMKLASKYNKPCVLFRKSDSNTYRGSARNCNDNDVNLKTVFESTKIFDFVQGHENAFGTGIKSDKVVEAISKCNEACKSYDWRQVVDFEFDAADISSNTIHEVIALDDYYGTGFAEPLIAIKNIVFTKDDVELLGKTGHTWKVSCGDFELLKFTDYGGEVIKWMASSFDSTICINAICKFVMSEFKGKYTPQIQIQKYERRCL